MEKRSQSQPPNPQHFSPAPKNTRTIDENEAVRRGLSFGPIKRRGQSGLRTEILRPTAGSPPPEGNRRNHSPSADQGSKNEAEKRKERGSRSSPRSSSKLAGESSEEEEVWSSGDEIMEARGRKKEVKDQSGKEVSHQSIVESFRRAASLDSQPSITVTAPADEKSDNKKTSSKTFHVHPNTNFIKPVQDSATGVRTASPTPSEEEELDATTRAQTLPIYGSNPDSSVPHRLIQTLLRGDFALMQREAARGKRHPRTYLAATDLSGEAAYALEWTIGTVLRDGDTLYAIYAVDEEVGTGADTEEGSPAEQGAATIEETKARIEVMTAESQKKSFISFPPLPRSVLRPSSRKGSAATSTDSRVLSIAQQERLHALNKLQDTCVALLRKTALQCRIVIEVIHCNNPKYMIIEAIDGINPAMAIIGSRGRSSLKG